MIELVTLINEDLREFAPFNCVENPAKAIYRLYRDTRFSKDKTPYKTHIAATFPRTGLPKHSGAGFYFSVSHKTVEVAAGCYMPEPDDIRTLRNAIASDEKTFLRYTTDRRLIRALGPLQGQKLSRLPKGFESHSSSPVVEYLKHKQFYWYIELPPKLALSAKLRKEVLDRFRLLASVVQWMNEALLKARASSEEEARPVRPEPMW